MQSKIKQFLIGARDALPVMFGYLSVAFTFGVIAVGKGLPLWAPTFISMTCFTGTGQFVGVDLISVMASIVEISSALLIINARYFLMGMSLAQKLPPEVKLWQRLIIAFGNTDENFAIAMSKNEKITFSYFCGLIFSSYLGWISGTVIGSLAGNIIPTSITNAMGIALYAMYIAIIVPPACRSKAVLCVIFFAILINSVIKFVPLLSNIGSGWAVIISGVIASGLGAVLFPLEVNESDA